MNQQEIDQQPPVVKQIPSDYGKITVESVKEMGSTAFSALYQELLSDKEWKSDQLATMLDSYTSDELYTLQVAETDSMWRRLACNNEDEFIGGYTFCVLPVILCVRRSPEKEGEETDCTVEFMWVHPRARGMGLARILVEFLRTDLITRKLFVKQPNEQFWKHFGFTPTDKREIWEYVWKFDDEEE